MTIFYIAMVVFIIVISAIASKKQKDAAHKRQDGTHDREVADSVPQSGSVPAKDEGPRPAYRHVVVPSFESGHAHQETSLTGILQCPASGTLKIVPSAHSDAEGTPTDTQTVLSLPLNADEATKAIIYSEILGRPKARRAR